MVKRKTITTNSKRRTQSTISKSKSQSRRRKSKLRLTIEERRLLEHPPTKNTWICSSCKALCSGLQERCVICAKPRSKKPTLLWPKYEAACAKVGIEPGYMWKISEKTGRPMTRLRGKSWVEVPEPLEV